MPVWGIHCDERAVDFAEDGLIAIGWDDVGDLSSLESERTAVSERLKSLYPAKGDRAIAAWAGVLFRFAHELAEGDIVVYPRKLDRTIFIGRVTGPYRFDATAETYRHRRDVEWLAQEVPRSEFTQPALYEIGAFITLFRVRNYSEEFLAKIGAAPLDSGSNGTTEEIESVTEEAEGSPSARRLQEAAPDFILSTLAKEAKGHAFEDFCARLLEAMGYRTRVTEPSGDGGVDVVAYRDPLGVEPPILRVQCKSTGGKLGIEEVQRLTAVLRDESELGVLVTLGSFTRDARVVARNQARIQLISGEELAELILEHYDALDAETKRMIPMRQVWLPDPET